MLRNVILIAAVISMPAAYAGDFGIGTWGMSKSEVKRIEKETLKRESNDELEYKGKIAGVDAALLYKFKNNQLVQGLYIFPGMMRLDPRFPVDPSGMTRQPNPYEDYYKIQTYLYSKYGNPVSHRQWEEKRGNKTIKNTANYWTPDGSLVSHVLSVADNGIFVAHASGFFYVSNRTDALQKLKKFSEEP